MGCECGRDGDVLLPSSDECDEEGYHEAETDHLSKVEHGEARSAIFSDESHLQFKDHPQSQLYCELARRIMQLPRWCRLHHPTENNSDSDSDHHDHRNQKEANLNPLLPATTLGLIKSTPSPTLLLPPPSISFPPHIPHSPAPSTILHPPPLPPEMPPEILPPSTSSEYNAPPTYSPSASHPPICVLLPSDDTLCRPETRLPRITVVDQEQAKYFHHSGSGSGEDGGSWWEWSKA